jgi:hypothetical protein
MVDERVGIAEIIEQCVALLPGYQFHDGFTGIQMGKNGDYDIRSGRCEAKTLGIEFLDNNAKKGRIGALGAVLWGNRGIEAAGLYGEHL